MSSIASGRVVEMVVSRSTPMVHWTRLEALGALGRLIVLSFETNVTTTLPLELGLVALTLLDSLLEYDYPIDSESR